MLSCGWCYFHSLFICISTSCMEGCHYFVCRVYCSTLVYLFCALLIDESSEWVLCSRSISAFLTSYCPTLVYICCALLIDKKSSEWIFCSRLTNAFLTCWLGEIVALSVYLWIHFYCNIFFECVTLCISTTNNSSSNEKHRRQPCSNTQQPYCDTLTSFMLTYLAMLHL